MITEKQTLEGRNVVITGTTRGLGARAALAFAKAGADIVGTYANPDPKSSKRQDRTIKACLDINPNINFTSVRVDITIADDRKAMMEAARKIDVLVLNAAGGMEEGKSEDWADRINHEAQLAIVEEALPYFSGNAKIIYMQSLFGHYFGKTRQLAIYESVARTKHAAERDLRARIPELAQNGVSLGVLVADAIEGTSVFSSFKRMLGEDFTKIGEQIEGGFPTADSVASAMVDMASTPWVSGYTKYVGRQALEPFDQSIIGRELSRLEIAAMLPMYADNSLLIDTFRLTGMDSGEATYTVRKQEYGDHFVGPYEKIKLEPAHYLAEIAAQTAGMVVVNTRSIGTGAPLYRGVTGDFEGMVFPGERIKTVTEVKRAVSGGVICTAKMFGQDGTLVADFSRIKFQILPTYEVAWRVYRKSRTLRGMAPVDEKAVIESENE